MQSKHLEFVNVLVPFVKTCESWLLATDDLEKCLLIQFLFF